MEENRENSHDTFTSAMTLSQMGLTSVPKHFILPPTQRPLLEHNPHFSMRALPVIDLSSFDNPLLQSQLIEELCVACNEFGAFQVIHHGVPIASINDALDAAAEFFDLPNENKMRLASSDVHKPVRYGTSLNHVNDKIKYWRDFVKHYSHPLSAWIDLWPSDPPSYKEKMGNYAKAMHLLHEKLMRLIFEGLGLKPDYLQEDVQQGLQVITVNSYPPCPEPNLALGLPPHSDYGCLTILLQNYHGLQIMDNSKEWQSVPVVKNGLVVQLGDQIEVITNGRYKSVVHRAILNSEQKRHSIASIHSMAIGKKATPAKELVDEKHPLSYREYSFDDFLSFLSDNDISEGRYIEKLKKIPNNAIRMKISSI